MIRIGIDIGGTFTDFAIWRGGKEGYTSVESFKLSSTPPTFADAVIEGLESIFGRIELAPDEPVVIVHGTTVSTNAVIERDGPPVAMLTTQGFRDTLNIQRLRLKKPTDLWGQRVAPLVPRERVYEIAERIGPGGEIELALDAAGVKAAAHAARQAGADGVVVSFLHSYRNPAHEQAAGAIVAQAESGLEVTLSSDIWPEQGEYERSVVTVLNGFVKRRMDAYLGQVERFVAQRLPQARLFITKSNGGAMSAAEARRVPVHTLLSGPASGVTAACHLAAMLKLPNLLTMDMGGTSADLSLVRDARPTVSGEAEVGGFPLMMPVTSIEAIGAGGGSIAAIASGVLTVGPESAGSRPGPACYDRGGKLPTMSDAYLLCGYLDPGSFLGGRMKLRRDLAAAAMQPIADHLGTSIEAAAEACINVATSNMVAATLPYLARHGMAARDLALVLYGGAGAVHGALLAEEIGVNTVIVPRLPSVFCAFGGLVTDLVYDSVRTLRGKAVSTGSLRALYSDLEAESLDWLRRQIPREWLSSHAFQYFAEMRYRGQSFELAVEVDADAVREGDPGAFERRFHAEHQRLYSYSSGDAAVEFISARVRIVGAIVAPDAQALPQDCAAPARPTGTRQLHLRGRSWPAAAVYDRRALAVGQRIEGPAVIEQGDATTLVPAEFSARVGAYGDLILERKG